MNLISKASLFSAIGASLLSCPASDGADWPNWRGPNHNGVSSETGWTANWPADGPTALWRFSAGDGMSSVSVSQGRVYTMGNQDDMDTVFCLDAESGKLIWKQSYSCALDAKNFEGGPTATPTISGNRVYTFSRDGAVYCFDAADGKVVWTKNLPDATAAQEPTWGFAGSALVEGNFVFLNAGASGIALNKTTGAVLWRTGAGSPGYATPLLCALNGTPSLLIMGATQLACVSPATGQVIWHFPWPTDYDINASDPIVSSNDIFISSGYGHGAALLRVQGAHVDPVWQNTNLRNQFSSSVLLNGFVYGIDGQAGHTATLKCIELQSGAVKWEYKGLGSGGLMAADGKLIVISDQGELVVATGSPGSFEPISRAQVLGGKCWTTPVLANGRIYCRNARGNLVCLDVKGKS